MKEQVIESLNALIGKPMWAAGRACDLHWFQFGEKRKVTDRKGLQKEVGEYALHITCAWRLCTSDQVIVASRDRYYPPNGEADVPDGFNWDAGPLSNYFDHKIKAFLADSPPPIVKAVEGGLAGSARIIFANDIALEIFPDDSLKDDSEYWRLFQPATDKKHFIVSERGIDE